MPLRAPTADEGLAAACRDTFSGTMRLRVWRKGAQGARFGSGVEVLSATSTSAALEVNRMVSLSLSLSPTASLDHTRQGLLPSHESSRVQVCFAGRWRSQGAVCDFAQVGGVPWWSTWKERAQMAEPLRSILNAPLPIEDVLANLPGPFRPPGL